MPLRDDLLNPIPGDNPSGANLRYDPVTDKIKEARREDLDVPQGEWKTALKAADYPQVIKLGSDVLAKRSKDLQIAVWLVDAHVRKEGFALLAPALQFLRDLLEQFWDSLYPPIDDDGDMEVRAAPLVWLGAKLGEPLGFLPIVSGKLSWLKYQESRVVGYESDADTHDKQSARETRINEGKITAEQFDEAAEETSVSTLRETYKQLNDALAALESLAEYCDSQFGDFSPSFIKTREAIEEIAQTVRIILGRKPGGLEDDSPGESTDTDFAAAESTDTDWDASSSDSSSSGSGATFGEPADLDDVGRQLASLCRFLRARDPEDPTPYLMMRSFAWGGLMNHAPQIDHSAIEAPASELRMNLKRLTSEGEWDQVLELTEASMLQPCGRTWLDMQRYAVNALEQKGTPSMARVINGQLRLLLETLPDLVDITLPDDTAAANPETKNWIENFVIIQKVTRDRSGDSSESSDSSDSGSDLSTDSFSADTFSFDETPSDTSFDTTTEPESTSEPELSAEPEPYEVEDNPPIMEADEPLPTDTSDEFILALQAVREGRTAEGLGMITSILATERSGRARFRRRTQLAHLLMAVGKGKVAQPMLDQLCAEIEDRRLEDWEQSEVIAYPLELLLHCLSPADEERRTQLYTRICKLDPVRAVNCSF